MLRCTTFFEVELVPVLTIVNINHMKMLHQQRNQSLKLLVIIPNNLVKKTSVLELILPQKKSWLQWLKAVGVALYMTNFTIKWLTVIC